MPYNLSILVPSIRTHLLPRLYESAVHATTRSWEMIIVSPYDLPPDIASKGNVKHFKDWGPPMRCQQIGLLHANGGWCTFIADDAWFLPGKMDIGFNMLEDAHRHGADYKTVVMQKYYEGTGNEAEMGKNDYYLVNYHAATRSSYVPGNYYTLNAGIFSRHLAYETGGWDCRFQCCPLAYCDFAIRCQNYGSKFLIQEEVAVQCDHLPGDAGDHAPIHYAQAEEDTPLYNSIYGSPNSMKRTKIDINNWHQSPNKWIRRFGS